MYVYNIYIFSFKCIIMIPVLCENAYSVYSDRKEKKSMERLCYFLTAIIIIKTIK